MMSFKPTLALQPAVVVASATDNWSAGRVRRIWVLMSAIWLMNGFDLIMTLSAHQQGLLVESNPVAHAILPHGPVALGIFKVALVLAGSLIFLNYRRHPLVEYLSWFLVVVYLGVSFRWVACYNLYDIIMSLEQGQPITQAMMGML
ncbi:MAG: hypothetical protein HJJLKODD_00099 [Phycisphaerae bacterium]|nr:hypothetical protein [Phycisphaerae bacterium]